ncbi:hypothetical protein CU102_03305 [Phyllobacterium brassicacearum]|uniref:Large polyvalent protein-associated domain-containing protein n=1 Tax=Phyllobacterium brassicacearum TaxID=314235 RepID=A0A2P7BUK7_9HYPH|nr:LPD7 domain-containing protein [Phyllobacterium brassicacearum]PSH70140.1 hypothetical protein CU102_03305 [Phyllobacterium brassicacearum]TDQ33990.1 hypothetical protein DEV91_104193 [Phyllobacterium brassicacearum]
MNPNDEEEKQLEFSLEIKRDPNKEIARPAAAVDHSTAEEIAEIRLNPDGPQLGTQKAEDRSNPVDRDREEENRRRQKDQGETSKDNEREQPKEHQPDRTFPADIQRRLYIRADHRGDQHVYADSQGKREIFQESGDKLCTKVNDAHAVKLMLDTAAHRGWSSIKVKGSQEFRREAWLEGHARGIAVTGYTPTELDLQELKNREQAYLRNEIVPAGDRAITQDRPQTVVTDTRRSSPGTIGEPNRDDGPGAPDEHTRADRRSSDYRDGLEGVLVEQGSRPYKDNPGNDPSPYVTLQDNRGERHTAWGVGLPDAMLKSGAHQGDYVRVREAGMETVTKTVLREINGQTVRVPKEVQRRAWDAEVLQEREASRIEHVDHEPQSSDDRVSIGNAANRDVGRSVSSAERTLHVGPGRDAALEDGVYANEARAEEYMATGRIAASRTPELKNAAGLEAYVERKVRQKYPNDPVLVERAMQTARTRISHSLARGYDFPQPRVVEMKQFDQGRQDRDQQGSQREQSQSEQREQNRNHNRSR